MDFLKQYDPSVTEGWQGAEKIPTGTALEEAMMGTDRDALIRAYENEILRKVEAGEKLTPEEAYVLKGQGFANWMYSPVNMLAALPGGAAASGMGLTAGFAAPFLGGLATATAAAVPAGAALGGLARGNAEKHAAYYQKQRSRQELQRNPQKPL